MTEPLPPDLTRAALAHLGVRQSAPDRSLLDALLHAYVRRVPWESAFRIVRRAQVARTEDCPRWPDRFWREAIAAGAGGTCFESNYAFFSLLRALGFDGYLTLNNMGETVACHTAVVLNIDGGSWLADVGMPIDAALPLDPAATTSRQTPFLTWSLRPDGDRRYQVERTPHPSPAAFTLVDEPVPDTVYRAATAADYGPNGFFLDRVIINKVVAGQPWRFNAGDQPYRLERFASGERVDQPLAGDPAEALSAHFAMDRETIRRALQLTAS